MPDEVDHERAISDALGHDDDPLLWIARPSLRGALHRLDTTSRLYAAAPAVGRRGVVAPAGGCRFELDEGRLVVWTSGNQRRAATGRAAPGDGTELARRSLRDVAVGASVASRVIRRVPGATGRDLPALGRLLAGAAMYLRESRSLLDAAKPRVVVVATQHSVAVRGVVRAARERRIPSVYVPHAPTATTRGYADLPFDLAVLRGAADVAYYTELGADRERTVAAGDPTIGDDAIPGAHDPLPLVAVSPWSDDILRSFIDTARAAFDDRFEIAPHPRSDLDRLRALVPPAVPIRTGRRTIDELGARRRPLVQAGSGVALEGLWLGSPVGDVAIAGRPNPFLFARDGALASLDGADDLQAFASAASDQLAGGDGARQRDLARPFVEAVGATARAEIERSIASAEFAGRPVLDGWFSGR